MPSSDHGLGDLTRQAFLDQAVQGFTAQSAGVPGGELFQHRVHRDPAGPAQMGIEHEGRHSLNFVFTGFFREQATIDDPQTQLPAGPGEGHPLLQGPGAERAGRCDIEPDFSRQGHLLQPCYLRRRNSGIVNVGRL